MQSVNPDAVLALGDLQYECGKQTQFEQAFGATWGAFKQKIHPVPGNHEYNDDAGSPICDDVRDGASGYYGYFGAQANPLDPTCQSNCQGYYSFDLGAWHIVALNSNCASWAAQRAPIKNGGSAQILPRIRTSASWRCGTIRDSARADTGMTTKRPRCGTGSYEAGAEVVLSGHDHDYERFAPMDADGNADPAFGVREFVVGTGGRNLTSFGDAKPNSEARSDTAFGALKWCSVPTVSTGNLSPPPGNIYRYRFRQLSRACRSGGNGRMADH